MDASKLKDDDVVYYAAVSTDGYIAGKDGGVSWLDPYFIPELGFHGFMARIKGAIMGRRTWDKMLSLTGGKSAYGETPCIVATHRKLTGAGPAIAAEGSPEDILAVAKLTGPGPWWIVGGADVAGQFLEAGVLTRADLFVIPELLGAGIPAFRNRSIARLDLIETETYPKSIVRLSYRPRLAA
ncbi:MAG: dihydrofolate reductase family protein [Cucumibacter sp.]